MKFNLLIVKKNLINTLNEKKPRYTVIIYMPAYRYCNEENAVNNKSAFMVAIELDKKTIYNTHLITLTLGLN